MDTLWQRLFDDAFMPHGHCFFWRGELVFLHVASDLLIAVSYMSIPLSIGLLLRERPDVEFTWLLKLFSAFIVACGTTHVMAIWTLWNADYALQGAVKAATAGVSMATAAALWPALPQLASIPSPAALQAANDRLHEEMEERRRAEARAIELAEDLDRRVRHRTRALAASNRELARFAHVASHDLREPMRTTLAFSQLLEAELGDSISDEARKHLEFVLNGCERMHELTTSLLGYARVGAQEMAMRPVDLVELFAGIQVDLSDAIARTGARVDVGALPEVRGDRVLLRQVFQNLLANSLAHAGGTRPVIQVRAQADEQGHHISVRDNGPGFDSGQAECLFEPFHRLDTLSDGTGMGLAIARAAVERHGGTIHATSTPGHGATFTVTLPYEHTESP